MLAIQPQTLSLILLIPILPLHYPTYDSSDITSVEDDRAEISQESVTDYETIASNFYLNEKSNRSNN